MSLKKISTLVLALAMASSLLVGCGGGGGSTTSTAPETSTPAAGGTGESYTIGFAPTTMNNPFWLAVYEGVKNVLEPAGVTLMDIDAQSDQATMNDQIGDLLAGGIDALLVAPMDSTGVKSALEDCKQANVPVINFDTPVTDLDLVESVIASDNFNAGYVVGKDMLERLPEGSKVAILHSPAGQACIDRYDGFMDAVGDSFEIVQVLDGQGDTGVSMPLAEDILQADPDLGAFFCVNDPSAIGAVRALEARNNTDVLVYGVDGSPDAKALIAEGKLTGTGAQSPISIGELSAQAALDILGGKSVEKEITVPTFLITADNVEEYGIDVWQ